MKYGILIKLKFTRTFHWN